MLDHMLYAHEFADGSVNTDLNASDINYRMRQLDESNSNSINDFEDARESDQRLDDGGSNSNDTSVNIERFDNGSGDNSMMTTNIKVVYGTNDENIVTERVECKLGFDDKDGDTTIDTANTTSSSLEEINFNSKSDTMLKDIMVSCEYSDGDEQEVDDEITVSATEASKSAGVNVRTKVSVVFDHLRSNKYYYTKTFCHCFLLLY